MERTLISLDGKLRSKGFKVHKNVYDGPEGTVDLVIIHDLVWIAANYKLDLKQRDNLVATVNVASSLFEALKSKGVKYVYCTAESPTAFKFNELLGFKSVNAVMHDKHEVMEKEL